MIMQNVGGGGKSSDCEDEANQGDHIGNSLKSYFGTSAKTASRVLPSFVDINTQVVVLLPNGFFALVPK